MSDVETFMCVCVWRPSVVEWHVVGQTAKHIIGQSGYNMNKIMFFNLNTNETIKHNVII